MNSLGLDKASYKAAAKVLTAGSKPPPPPPSDEARRLVWRPNPGPQTLLLLCGYEDVFFGGARGGGKTDGILGDAASHMLANPQHANGVIFRKSYKQMDEIIRRSLEIYTPMGFKYNAAEYTWRHPKGSILRLRYLDVDADAEEYQGFNLTYLGFDEAGNWPTSYGIDKLWGTLRSAHGVPTRRRLTGNPGGPGTIWLRKRYIENRTPGQPFLYKPYDDCPFDIQAVFIPSRLEDNPALTTNDPNYEKRLYAVGDRDLIQAWRWGDWWVLKGAYFSAFDEGVHVYNSADLDPWLPRWIAVDWGFAHDSAVLWGAWDGQDVWVERESLVRGRTPIQLAEHIVRLNNGQPLERIFLSHDAFSRRTNERTIAGDMGDVFRAAGLPLPTSSDRDRKGSLQVIQHRFATQSLRIHAGCRQLIQAVKMAQRDEKDPEDVMKWEGDDALDALMYLVKVSPGDVRVPQEVEIRRALTDAKDPHSRMMKERILRANLLAGRQGVRERASGPRWLR